LVIELIDACDSAGVRLIVLTDTAPDRASATALDFSEICPSATPWVKMLDLLRAPTVGGGDIPDMAFFDIVTHLDSPPPALSPAFLTALPQLPTVGPDQASESRMESDHPASREERDEETPAHVIAVWGPTGAPGRTTVAVNLAAELVSAGHSVLLIDADSYGGAVAARLGLLDETPGFAAACRLADNELLTRHELERLSQKAEVGGSVLSVLTGILRPDRWPELSAQRVGGVLATCREFFDVIIVDTGFNVESDEEISSDLFSPRRNAATLTVLAEADTIVAVSDSSVVGLARFLRASADVRDMHPNVALVTVANRVRSRVAGIAPRAQVRQTLERFGGLSDIIIFPFDDRALDECELRASVLCIVAPRSALRKSFVELARRCLLTEVTAQPALSRGRLGSASKLFARRRG
jgi:cellulose biosynthesis protein BcsQ